MYFARAPVIRKYCIVFPVDSFDHTTHLGVYFNDRDVI